MDRPSNLENNVCVAPFAGRCIQRLCLSTCFATGLFGCLPAFANGGEFIVGLDNYAPAPSAARLRAEGETRAQTMAMLYKARRLEAVQANELALATYEKVQEGEPANYHLTSRIARLTAQMGKFNAALALLEKRLEANRRDSRAWIAISQHFMLHHHGADDLKAKALQYARQALDLFPDQARVHDHLIELGFNLLDQPGSDTRAHARGVMQRAFQSKSTDPEFWLSMAITARKAYPLDDKSTREANLQAILKFSERAESLSRDNLTMLEALADYYAKLAGQLQSFVLLQKTLPLLEEISALRPGNLQARHKHAAALLKAGEEERALKIYKDLVSIDARDLEARRALLQAAEREGDMKQVVLHRREILRWEGGSAKVWLDLGAAMLRLSQQEEAVSLFKRAQLVHQEDAWMPYRRACVELSLHRNAEALSAFQEAHALAEKFKDDKHPGNVALLSQADFYYDGARIAATQSTQSELAAQWYRKSVELAPKNDLKAVARCYHELGRLWLEHGEKIEEAGELLRSANEMVRDDPVYMHALGWFHLKTKSYEPALELLSKAEKTTKVPDSALSDHLAQTLWSLNRRTEAIARLEKAVATGAASEDIKKRLATYRVELP